MKKLYGIGLTFLSATMLTSCLGKSDATQYDALKGEIDELRDLIENGEYEGSETSLDNVVSTVYNDVKDSTVGIRTTFASGAGSVGSGTIYKVTTDGANKTYRVVTNQHVVNGGSSYKVLTVDGIYHNANLVGETNHGTDGNATDIAVLEFTSTITYDAIEFGYGAEVDPGQFAIAIGSPLSTNNVNTVTFGIISRITNDKYQHDASINPGNSGGALLNTDGQLVGVNVEKFNYTDDSMGGLPEGMGLAIDLGHTLAAIRESEDNKKVFGASVITLFNARATNLLDYNNTLGPSNGIYVSEVNASSVANTVGLESGDIITDLDSTDGTKTSSLATYNDFLVALHRGYFENNGSTTNELTITYYDVSENTTKEVEFTF